MQKKFTDDQAAKAIAEGIKNDAGKVLMPPKKDKLTADEIAEVVAYVRTLAGK